MHYHIENCERAGFKKVLMDLVACSSNPPTASSYGIISFSATKSLSQGTYLEIQLHSRTISISTNKPDAAIFPFVKKIQQFTNGEIKTVDWPFYYAMDQWLYLGVPLKEVLSNVPADSIQIGNLLKNKMRKK